MPVKYQCPKCGRRFAEWGAEKLGFTCPADENCPDDTADESIELVRMGINDERLPTKKAAPKRLVRRPLAAVDALGDPNAADEVGEFDDAEPDAIPNSDGDGASEDTDETFEDSEAEAEGDTESGEEEE